MDVIIGAGLAGLTAGLDLAKRGRSVTVLEEENVVGGHASSYRLTNGYFHDQGYHVIIPDAIPLYEMVKAVGIESDLVRFDMKFGFLKNGQVYIVFKEANIMSNGTGFIALNDYSSDLVHVPDWKPKFVDPNDYTIQRVYRPLGLCYYTSLDLSHYELIWQRSATTHKLSLTTVCPSGTESSSYELTEEEYKRAVSLLDTEFFG